MSLLLTCLPWWAVNMSRAAGVFIVHFYLWHQPQGWDVVVDAQEILSGLVRTVLSPLWPVEFSG